MEKGIKYSNKLVHFTHWTRNSMAVFFSLHKIIKIGVMVLNCSIILCSSRVSAQESDTLSFSRDLELEEVEIVSQASPDIFDQQARTITIITSSQIESSPAASIQDILEYAGSLDIRQRNTNGVQADIQLRGGSFDQVLVLLNGINITDPQTGHFNLNIPVELSSVERIEILHGSAARIYGANAYKGAINIVTKTRENSVGASLQYGQYNQLHTGISAGFARKKFSGALSLNSKTSEGFTDNTDYKIRNLYYQGGYDMGDFRLYWQTGLNAREFGANDFYSPSFPDQFEENTAGFTSAGFSLKKQWELNGQAYWRRHSDHFLLKRDDPEFYENYHLSDVYGFKINTLFNSKFGETYLGIEGRREGILSTVLGNKMDKPKEIKNMDGEFYTNSYSRDYYGLFVQQKYFIGRAFVNGGFLMSANADYKNQIAFFPGIDGGYYLADNTKLFFSLNRSLRLPTFTDMFYRDPVNQGNSDLNPEKLDAFEMGIQWKPGNFRHRITVFLDKGYDVIDWVMSDSSNIYHAQNIGKTFSNGVEINLEYNNPLSASAWQIKSLGLSYAFVNQTSSSAGFDSKYAGDYLRNKLILYSNINLLPRLGLDFQLSYFARNGSYPDIDTQSLHRHNVDFKPYWLGDAKLRYRSEYFSLFVKASNVFNTSYTDVGSLIQAGRWVSIGVDFYNINRPSAGRNPSSK
jgi:vitamin B12 transporter